MGKYSRIRQQNSQVLTVDLLATPLVSVSIGAWLPPQLRTPLYKGQNFWSQWCVMLARGIQERNFMGVCSWIPLALVDFAYQSVATLARLAP